MSAYLGTLGRLTPIYSTPSMGVTGMPARSYETTLEGRVKAQVQPVGRRTWELSAEYATPAEIGNLMAFASGEWGHGPFVWVSPTAPAINLLTPEQASCDPSTVGSPEVYSSGPLNLGADGFAGRSLTNAGTGNMYFGTTHVPVLQGVPLTASAYLLGAGSRAGVTFYASDGSIIDGTAVESAEVGNDGSAARLSLTTIPPAGAVSCLVYGSGSTQVGARPAVTWTDRLMGWGAGEGCSRVVVDVVDRTALRSSRTDNHGRQSTLSFTIREVG